MNQGINIPEYRVSQFNKIFKDVVEDNFNYLRIRGEISELKNAASGHIYLTLKDDNSVLNGMIWSQKKNYLKINPEIGMEVIVTGKISTYAKSISTYSISIDGIELAGEGALLKLIEDRKKKLKEKGIFDEINKKEIPFLPNKIGVITSATGSVIHDIINRIKDRFPTNIDIWPVSVQGVKAVEDIIVAIEGFNSKIYSPKPEVIIIARGGGSTEDLMPFNDEKLVLSIYASNIPIISAIGHETDTTIVDYVSDLRASTPTAAAELAVPEKNELDRTIQNLSTRLNNYIKNKIKNYNSELFSLKKFLKVPNHILISYKDRFNILQKNIFKVFQQIFIDRYNKNNNLVKLLRSPENLFQNSQKQLLANALNLNKNLNTKITNKNNQLNYLTKMLESNSIHKNLEKGYSIIKKADKIINKSQLIFDNDELNIQFLDKKINLKIKKII